MIQYLLHSRSTFSQCIYQNRIHWFNKYKPDNNSIYYVCSKKKNGCKGSISISFSDRQKILRHTDHSCLSLTDFQAIALVRFDELKTTVQDVSKKSVQIHDLWKDISYYSLLMTYYESSMRVVL